MRLSRRRLLGFLLSFPLLSLLKSGPAYAAKVVDPDHLITKRGSTTVLPEKLKPLIREATGGVPPRLGRVRLSLPALAESGNSVRLKVEVESPMTAETYVRRIHIFSEKNPRPLIARFSLSPRAGRAEVSTRIRLAGTQRVLALAVMNDGSAWMATAEVVVTAAACVEGS
jgi:sulfur-oxidizing protein SoxY